MKNKIAAFFVGLLFSLGLGISGMTRPLKVFGFLDIFGNWNASLIFVMIGAIAVHLVTYRIILNQKLPLFSDQWHLPTKKEITLPLVIGSFLFGVGWALAGYCPGPALTSLSSFEFRPALFFASMIFGMFGFRLLDRQFNFKR
ncbi:MAG: YeeE/YedE family protein [Bdellovibrionaceae bacterium]|nr:YeeE/YedE family protein [Bdellovibrio sp.]